MNKRTRRTSLFPPIEPYETGRLKVGPVHELYYEVSGNPAGIPVVGLHGGPGGGSSPDMRRFFDPRRYRIVLFDQRGCGRSSPHSELADNTTWDSVADIERLRTHLKIASWVVFGGSWGSTLALTYAASHPGRVSALILRGIFLLTQSEIRWFYQEGASRIFPDAFDRYQSVIPEAERGDFLKAFYKRLTGPHGPERRAAAHAWAGWEGDTISIKGPAARPSRFEEDDFVDAFARIECHYFVNKGFFDEDGWLLNNAHRFAHIPGVIVHGRYDVVTPLSSAWALSKVWPAANLTIVPDAGHSSVEPGIVARLIEASEMFAEKLG
jgi:proline iminopeptidase